ncbi:MAG: hypothetical protein JSR39_09735 [Verrucomicrobia bacterium]|nr:hypothetical protein [Verrucomicrobiota bacterium]
MYTHGHGYTRRFYEASQCGVGEVSLDTNWSSFLAGEATLGANWQGT